MLITILYNNNNRDACAGAGTWKHCVEVKIEFRVYICGEYLAGAQVAGYFSHKKIACYDWL